ncbi:hypothetical protein [Roseibium sp. RKSG952]|nr:hypothetical protein [Roseibium sp. RKSG952]
MTQQKLKFPARREVAGIDVVVGFPEKFQSVINQKDFAERVS